MSRKNARLALLKYILTARLIRSNGFENSIASKLEDIIAGDFELCKTLVGIEDSDRLRYDFSKSFVAIAAPSLEGKTQFAFVLEKARPLYFALGAGNYSSGSYTPQSIYLNFKDLNTCIETFAKDDLARILADEPSEELKNTIKEVIKEGKSKAEKPEVILRITADELKQHVNKKKLYTLGLLYKLVEDARLNYDESRQPWMEYHAHRTSFNVIPKSISELPVNVDFFKDFSLFLDEFRGYDWAIYIRNLARAIGLRCCVSNTNAKVANLVGKHQSIMSGAEGEFVWSVVVTELKLSNYQTLNYLTNIDLGINLIRENVISDEFEDDKEHFDSFFQDFKLNQINHLRPGVSLAVAQFINRVCMKQAQNPEKITFQSFFSKLVQDISGGLSFRKPLVKTSINGKAANLSLLLSPSYNRQKNEANLNSVTNYLEDHFYYLTNPSNSSNWLFLTFPSASQSVSFPLEFLKENEKYTWGAELTYFKKEEILTILACMNLFHYSSESFSFILDQIFNASKTLSFDTGSTENPMAVKRDGNRLEVLATLCASHSSHHDPLENRKNCFKGQSGSNFLMNLLFNLIISCQTETVSIDLNYTRAELGNFNIQKYLEEEVLIPFLYVSNFELPQVFQNSDILDRSIKMGKLTRTTDKSRIDIEFPYYNLNLNQKLSCKIECKNWRNKLPLGNLLEIFKRAEDTNMPLSITVCNEIVNAQAKTEKIFSDYCYEHQINAYRFSRLSSSSFYLVPLSNYLSDDPLMIAFVIELNIING